MRSKRPRRDLSAGIAFLLPNFLGFAVFMAGPVIFSLVVSFSNWSLLRTEPFEWVGFRNYVSMFTDQSFWLYLINTGYLMLGLPISICGSLFLAILLTRNLRGIVVYRTLFYLPAFTAGVALFLLWRMLLDPGFGPINACIEWVYDLFGATDMEGPKWLASVRNLLCLGFEKVGFSTRNFGVGAREALIVMGIWIAIGGNNMLLYIAGISNIPQELYEAADIDGAGAWGKFRHVTWPQLAPTTFFIGIMSFIGGLQGGFEQARVMTGGGPAGTTTTLTYYIYTKAFEEFQIGYASAIAWVLFALIFAITLVNWRFGSRHVND